MTQQPPNIQTLPVHVAFDECKIRDILDHVCENICKAIDDGFTIGGNRKAIFGILAAGTFFGLFYQVMSHHGWFWAAKTTKVDCLQREVGQLQQKEDGLEKNLKRLESDSTNEVASLKGQVAALKQGQEQLKIDWDTKVQSLENESRSKIKSLQEQASTLERGQEQFKIDWDTKVQSLENESKSKIKSLQEQVSTLEKGQDQSKIDWDTKVQSLEARSHVLDSLLKEFKQGTEQKIEILTCEISLATRLTINLASASNQFQVVLDVFKQRFQNIAAVPTKLDLPKKQPQSGPE